MSLRRLLVGLLVVGLFFWVVTSPHEAGSLAGQAVHTLIGWGKSGVTAIVTFAESLMK